MLQRPLQQIGSDWKAYFPGWLTSLMVHLLFLCAIAMLLVPRTSKSRRFTVSVPYVNEEVIESPPQHFEFRELNVDAIGADSGTLDQLILTDVPLVQPDLSTESPEPLAAPLGEVELQQTIAVSTGIDFAKNYSTRGQVGVGLSNTGGAIARLTHEILRYLEERPTLVVWLLDQSPSLLQQRVEIRRQLARVYHELGQIQASGIFAHDDAHPLLSSVIAFGQEATLLTDKPTDNVELLKEVFGSVSRDDSGIENIYSAILLAAKQYRGFRRASGDHGQPLRNVVIIAFTDEVGDDQHLLDEAIELCGRRYEMPVYVVGVPAPFGQAETFVKWIDPNPNYDQTPRWAMVNQGPESLLPERVKLAFASAGEYEAPLDSGFGPFGLTRLTHETGGIYFAVHPNRDTASRVDRRRVKAYTAHISQFFDEEVMRRYKPDYVSKVAYLQALDKNATRRALVKAAEQSWIHPMDEPRMRFIMRDRASFVESLSEAQKLAAKLEPQLNRLYNVLRSGEKDRDKEESLRWQAGYDLAIGRTLAALARTRAYNTMLALAKRGLEPSEARHNTWTLIPSETLDVNSQLKRIGDEAQIYLKRVVSQHPQTPWATLAARELARPLGWRWQDSYTLLPEDVARMRAQNPNRMPRNDRARMLPPRPVKRDVPRL